MGLTKHKIGEFVRTVSIKCGEPKCSDVSGINIDKKFIQSRNVGEDTSKYSVVPPNCFAFNLMHVGRDEKIPIALNYTDNNVIVSPAYFVFEIIDEAVILSRYFYIIMSSPEFDRYSWFCTDSSIRGNLEWSRFYEIELDLPDIETQKKYVDVYETVQKNISLYESGLENLQNTCDAYIKKLIAEVSKQVIGKYIEQSEEKNTDLKYVLDDVRGIATSREFIETKANMGDVSLHNYKIVNCKQFAYVADTSRRGDKISLAYNSSQNSYLVSSISTIFKVKDKNGYLLPHYLFMYLCRPDFDRYARFNSWGSAREVITWEDLCRYEIPLPSIEIQKDIIGIFSEYGKRKQILDRLKALQKSMCPILIKGALTEAQKK